MGEELELRIFAEAPGILLVRKKRNHCEPRTFKPVFQRPGGKKEKVGSVKGEGSTVGLDLYCPIEEEKAKGRKLHPPLRWRRMGPEGQSRRQPRRSTATLALVPLCLKGETARPFKFPSRERAGLLKGDKKRKKKKRR